MKWKFVFWNVDPKYKLYILKKKKKIDVSHFGFYNSKVKVSIPNHRVNLKISNLWRCRLKL